VRIVLESAMLKEFDRKIWTADGPDVAASDFVIFADGDRQTVGERPVRLAIRLTESRKKKAKETPKHKFSISR
jgi:hypothetical protein